MVLYPGFSVLLRFALSRGVHLPSMNWDNLIFPVALLLLLVYSFLALSTVYPESFFLSFVKELVWPFHSTTFWISIVSSSSSLPFIPYKQLCFEYFC